MFKFIFNPILWFLRLLTYLICGAIAVGSVTFFFAGGWFVIGFMFIIGAEVTDFHNGLRSAFKHKNNKTIVDYALDYKAPTRETYRTNWGENMLVPGYQDEDEVFLIRQARGEVIRCPGCQVPFEPPFPDQCSYCHRPLKHPSRSPLS